MNKLIWHFDLNSNIAGFDRVIRYAVGFGLIAFTLVAPELFWWTILLPLVSVPIIVSAIIGWDPFYAIFQKSPIPGL